MISLSLRHRLALIPCCSFLVIVKSVGALAGTCFKKITLEILSNVWKPAHLWLAPREHGQELTLMNEQCSQQAKKQKSTDPKIPKNQQTPQKIRKKNEEKIKTKKQLNRSPTKKMCFSDKEMLMWSSVMTPFLTRNDANQKTPCARSVRPGPHVCCQVYKSTKVPSLSQQHRHGSHRIQVHTKQYPQVPMFSLVPCGALLNTVPTHSAPDETQRVATKHVPSRPLSEMMSATIPSQWNVLHPLTLVPARNETRQYAHQRHTRSVQSSSCAEGGFFSQVQSVSVHGLQPKRVVLHVAASATLSIRRVARTTLNQRI